MVSVRKVSAVTKKNVNSIPVNKVVQNYSMEAKRIFGNKLRAVILYGSYARGDFEPDSDIDIMVLLDIPVEQLPEARKKCVSPQMHWIWNMTA